MSLSRNKVPVWRGGGLDRRMEDGYIRRTFTIQDCPSQTKADIQGGSRHGLDGSRGRGGEELHSAVWSGGGQGQLPRHTGPGLLGDQDPAGGPVGGGALWPGH